MRSNLQSLANYNADDKTLRVTSNSMQTYDLSKSVMSVRFATSTSDVNITDLSSAQGFINGERAGVKVISQLDNTADLVSIYPNPANGIMNVVSPEKSTIQLMDLDGRQVVMQ